MKMRFRKQRRNLWSCEGRSGIYSPRPFVWLRRWMEALR